MYNTDVPISINEIESVIGYLNKAAFQDFDSLLHVVRDEIERSLKLYARQIVELLDYDRNSKIDKNDINQTWKKIKQAAQDHFKLTPYQVQYINESPLVTELHLLSIVPLHVFGQYYGFWNDLSFHDF
jgi:hypothetical protein